MLAPFLSGFFATLGGCVALLALIALPTLLFLAGLFLTSRLQRGEGEEVIRLDGMLPGTEPRNGYHEDHLLN